MYHNLNSYSSDRRALLTIFLFLTADFNFSTRCGADAADIDAVSNNYGSNSEWSPVPITQS